MSQPPAAPLLWINKDATNVHRKKHVAEVNAHVQRSSLKKRLTRRPEDQRKAKASIRNLDKDETVFASSRLDSNSPTIEEEAYDCDASRDSLQQGQIVLSSGASDASSESFGKVSTPVIFSSYWDDGLLQITDISYDGFETLPLELDRVELTNGPDVPLLASLDASNPLPGFMTDLSAHDRMLVHTHLTYMPQMFFGLGDRAVYCPIRTASVANMLKEPVGVVWVLISLDMFLETARKSNTRKNDILQRKGYAYHLMSDALSDQSQIDNGTVLLGPAAAAIAEMFCGDSAKALTHLNGIDAFITARGGMEYVKQMDLTTSMPIFAVSAYRTLLQDNLTNTQTFERARGSFLTTMRSLIIWNKRLDGPQHSVSQPARLASPQDEGFDGDYDLVEGARELHKAREQAFVLHSLLRKFIVSEYPSSKPGERVDHFVVLYNLNRAIMHHGTNLKQAAQFIDALVKDIEIGGSTRNDDSSIKISGVLRLLTNRQAKMHPYELSEGIVHAWEAIDALEIMKLLSWETQNSVRETLHSLLVGRTTDLTKEIELDKIDSELTARWQVQCSTLSRSPG